MLSSPIAIQKAATRASTSSRPKRHVLVLGNIHYRPYHTDAFSWSSFNV